LSLSIDLFASLKAMRKKLNTSTINFGPLLRICILILTGLISNSLYAQDPESLPEMPLKDRYALYAWHLESQNLLNFNAVDHPDFKNFSVLLLRDLFPDKRNEMSELLKANNNEFGKKMFADTIIRLVELLKPYPFGKEFVFYGKGDLSEYDFNNHRFSVYPNVNSYFSDWSYNFFTVSTGMVTSRYKKAEEISVPILFNMPVYQNDDTLSIYRKGWNFINLQADESQKLLGRLKTENSGAGKREVYIKLIYSPAVFQNRILVNTLSVNYYVDSLYTDLICSYPVPKSPVTKYWQAAGNNVVVSKFAEKAFIRSLTPPHEKFRYVIYKGALTSEDINLDGKVFYFSAVYENFSEKENNRYLQLMANSLREYVDDPMFPKYWCQAGTSDDPAWVEGFRGLSMLESGKKGTKVGLGSKQAVDTHEKLKDAEFSITSANGDFYSVDRKIVLYDKKGKELASCILAPFSGNLSEEPVHVNLLFCK